MEMTYDGKLVIPTNFVRMDEEEMTYVEGGWSSSIAKSNLRGMNSWLRKHAPSRVLASTGVLKSINNILKYYANATYARVAGLIAGVLSKVSTVINAVGSWVWYVAIGAATLAGAYAIGTKRFF